MNNAPNLRLVTYPLYLLVLLIIPGTALAATPNPLTDSYTFVRLLTDFGGNNVESEEITIGGNSNHSYSVDNSDISIPEALTDSYAEATGRAGPGILGGKALTGGFAVDEVRVDAGHHDVFTVLGSQPVGSTGTLKFVYRISGQTIVNYDLQLLDSALSNGQVFETSPLVAAHMFTNTYGPDGNGGAEIIDFNFFSGAQSVLYGDLPACPLPCGIIGGSPFNLFVSGAQLELDVPFIYGEPLALSTIFRLRVFPDQKFVGATFNPFKEHWTNHFSEQISADFNETAALIAIVNADDPNATITAPSGFDYSSLVTAVVPAPVPLPAAFWLFASSIFGALVFRRKKY